MPFFTIFKTNGFKKGLLIHKPNTGRFDKINIGGVGGGWGPTPLKSRGKSTFNGGCFDNGI